VTATKETEILEQEGAEVAEKIGVIRVSLASHRSGCILVWF
jgi:hypothetical protein